MKKMKKVLACAVAATMTASLAACSSGNSTETAAPTAAAKTDATEAAKEDTTAAASSEKVTVTFWDENAGDERTQYDIIENFEKENPDIHIEYLGLSAGDALSKYQTAIAAGETPDVGGLNNSWAATVIGQNHCVAMDDMFAAWDGSKDIEDGYMQTCRTYNKDLYDANIS